jgi:hypothetical protein
MQVAHEGKEKQLILARRSQIIHVQKPIVFAKRPSI